MKKLITFVITLLLAQNHYGQIIADHNVVSRFNDIPQQYIDEVKKMLVDIAGASHSSGYRNGLNLLENIDSKFQVLTFEGSRPSYSNAYLRLGTHAVIGEEHFYTTQTAVNAFKNHITEQNSTGNSYSVIGFGWCWDMTWQNDPGGSRDPVYQVRWAGASEGGPDGNLRWGLDSGDKGLTNNSVCMDTYLQAIEQYIAHSKNNGYNTRVIFTTGPVDNEAGDMVGTENGFQREIKHDYIRNYVKADNSRILFDYADILCWNNSEQEYNTSWNDGGTGRIHPNIHPDNMKDYDASWNIIPHTEDGDHIGEVGALRLAKAMWWLLARIAGWDGNVTSVPEYNNDSKDIIIAVSMGNIKVRSEESLLPVTVSLFDLTGNTIATFKTHNIEFSFDSSRLGPGIYIVNVSGKETSICRKIMVPSN